MSKAIVVADTEDTFTEQTDVVLVQVPGAIPKVEVSVSIWYLLSTMIQPQVETHEMGVQYKDGGEQVNLIATENWTFWEHPIVEAVSTVKSNPVVCIYPLQYVTVTVSGCDCIAMECQIANGCSCGAATRQ